MTAVTGGAVKEMREEEGGGSVGITARKNRPSSGEKGDGQSEE